MLNNRIRFCSLWCVLGAASLIHAADESIESITKSKLSLFEKIVRYSEHIEVFPHSIWTNFTDNQSNWTGRYGKRFDLTFDKYIPLHEFKEAIYKVSFKDILDCIERVDEATPKQKALILAAIYLYERIHRQENEDDLPVVIRRRPRQAIVGPILHEYLPIRSITPEQWKKMIDVIEKYKEDDTIAFPAVVGEDKAPLKVVLSMPWEGKEWPKMKIEWEANYERCKERFYEFGLTEEVLKTPDHWRYQDKMNMLGDTAEARELKILYEYFYTIGHGMRYSSMLPFAGNSSAKPKTLGDIATQLLQSRPRYDGDEP